jgi:hypothetical protein
MGYQFHHKTFSPLWKEQTNKKHTINKNWTNKYQANIKINNEKKKKITSKQNGVIKAHV